MNAKDYQRITSLVVDKVAAWWKPYNDGMIDAVVEDLAEFSDVTLEKAMKHLRRTCKNQPKIAQIVEACKEQTATKESGALPVYSKQKEAIDAEAIMRSPIGRYAAMAGHSRDMWIAITSAGKREFTVEDIRGWQRAKAESIQLLTHFPNKKFPLYEALEKMFGTMCKLNEELSRKYAA